MGIRIIGHASTGQHPGSYGQTNHTLGCGSSNLQTGRVQRKSYESGGGVRNTGHTGTRQQLGSDGNKIHARGFGNSSLQTGRVHGISNETWGAIIIHASTRQ